MSRARRSAIALGLGLLLVVTAVGCSRVGLWDERRETSGTVTAAELEGRRFTAVRAVRAGVASDLQVEVRFQDGVIGTQARCNHQGGRYRIVDGRLDIDPKEFNTTQMGCDEERHAEDYWTYRLLAAGPTIEAVGDTIVLRHDAEELVLTEVR